jgi:hypothetical protein
VGLTTRLGILTIISAEDLTADSSINATSIVQQVGSGTTTFSGAVNTSTGAGVSITGTNLQITGSVTTTADGVFTVNNTGTALFSAAGDISADGSVSLTALGGIQTAGDITTTNDNVTLVSATTLTGAVAIDTGTGAGTIAFNNSLNGGYNLTLAAGTGNIHFDATVGQSTPLARLQIVSVADATFDAAVSAGNFVQNAGTGTTTFTGILNTLQLAGVSVTGNQLRVSAGITTSGAGTVTVVLNGTAPNGKAIFDNGASISSDGAVSLTAFGGLTTGGDITTTNDDISITAAVTLSGSITINSGVAAGDISFSSTIDGTTANSQSLTLNSGAAGTITVTGAIGKSTSLRILTIAHSNGATLGTLDSDLIVRC